MRSARSLVVSLHQAPCCCHPFPVASEVISELSSPSKYLPNSLSPHTPVPHVPRNSLADSFFPLLSRSTPASSFFPLRYSQAFLGNHRHQRENTNPADRGTFSEAA